MGSRLEAAALSPALPPALRRGRSCRSSSIAGFDLLKPWPLQLVIDHVLGGKPSRPRPGSPGLPAAALLVVACIGLVVVNLGAGLLALLHNYTTIARRPAHGERSARRALRHLQRLSLAFHSRQKVGDLMYRITADSFAVQTMIMNGLLPILSALVLLAGMLVVLLPLDRDADAGVAHRRAGCCSRSSPSSTARSPRSPPRCASARAMSTRWSNGR